MKKYLIIAAAAALALASCAKVETYKVSEDTPISFGVYSGRSLTKADTDNYASGATLFAGADFDVYGWYTANGTSFTGANGTQFMDWYTVTYQTGGNADGNGSKNLYPDGYRYWPTGSDPNYLSFCAYYPSNKGDIGAPAAGLGAYTFTAKAAAANQVDFMVADVVADQTFDKRETSSTGVYNPGTNSSVDGEVHLTFRHMLTKVQFKFKTTADVADDSKSHIEIYLKDAKLQDIHNTGTLTSAYLQKNNEGVFSDEVGYDDSKTPLTWATRTLWSSVSGTAEYDIFYNKADINNLKLTDTATSVADEDIFLMVPQAMIDKGDPNPQALYLKWDVKDLITGVTTENEATVYFKNDLKNGDDPTDPAYAAKEIDWAKNMFVTYTITISPQPILFTAEVANWDAEQFGYFNVN